MTEKNIISLYQAHTELLSLNKNDCFTIEEAAKALDHSFTCRDLRENEPQEFETFLDCVCENVKTLIQPYLKTKATSSGCDQCRSVLFCTMKPNFPSGMKLEGVHKRIKRIYTFVAYIEDEYRKERDASDTKKTFLVSARVNHPLDSEESEDEDYATPVHDDQRKPTACVKKLDPDYIAGKSIRKRPFENDGSRKSLGRLLQKKTKSYFVSDKSNRLKTFESTGMMTRGMSMRNTSSDSEESDDEKKPVLPAACEKHPGPSYIAGQSIKR